MKVTLKQGNVVLGGVSIVVGILIVILTKIQNLSFIQKGMPGPGMFPIICGVAIAVFGLIIILETTMKRKHEEEIETEIPEEKNILNIAELKNLGIFTGAGVLIILLSNVIGLLTTLTATVFLYISLVGKEKWWKAGLISIGTAVFLYIVFIAFLRVPVPKGPLGF